jgi:hypothetical protein
MTMCIEGRAVLAAYTNLSNYEGTGKSSAGSTSYKPTTTRDSARRVRECSWSPPTTRRVIIWSFASESDGLFVATMSARDMRKRD